MVLLVSHGADMKEAKLSPLLYAILRRDFATARELCVKQRVDVNAYANAKIVTPLLAAIESRNFDLCQLLLAHGADCNAATRMWMQGDGAWEDHAATTMWVPGEGAWKERRMTPLRKAILQVRCN